MNEVNVAAGNCTIPVEYSSTLRGKKDVCDSLIAKPAMFVYILKQYYGVFYNGNNYSVFSKMLETKTQAFNSCLKQMF